MWLCGPLCAVCRQTEQRMGVFLILRGIDLLLRVVARCTVFRADHTLRGIVQPYPCERLAGSDHRFLHCIGFLPRCWSWFCALVFVAISFADKFIITINKIPASSIPHITSLA